MKTINLKSLGVFALFFALFALPLSSKAQVNCPYRIYNLTNCDAKVNITLYNKPCADCICTVCNVFSGITIPAGQFFDVPCQNCAPVCNIDVTLIALGVAIPPVTVSYPNPPNTQPVLGSPCIANITAGASKTVIQ